MIKWNKISKEDGLKIDQIVKRLFEEKDEPKVYDTRLTATMDISATHIDITLNLDKLLQFDNFNFYHDICGIYANLNRTSGKIENCFVPRSAK